MKIFNVVEKKIGTWLVTITCYDNKVYKMMRKQFEKMKRQVDVIEVKE